MEKATPLHTHVARRPLHGVPWHSQVTFQSIESLGHFIFFLLLLLLLVVSQCFYWPSSSGRVVSLRAIRHGIKTSGREDEEDKRVTVKRDRAKVIAILLLLRLLMQQDERKETHLNERVACWAYSAVIMVTFVACHCHRR